MLFAVGSGGNFLLDVVLVFVDFVVDFSELLYQVFDFGLVLSHVLVLNELDVHCFLELFVEFGFLFRSELLLGSNFDEGLSDFLLLLV